MFTLLALFSGIGRVWSQSTYEYDGISTVELTNAYNFTLKYALGDVRDTVIWQKKLTVNVLGKTSEKDLVFAIGTQQEYFAATIAYDGGIKVPFDNGEPVRSGHIFVTPPNGDSLQLASPTLEQQYGEEIDFRDALIPSGTTQTDGWEKVGGTSSGMGGNKSPLVLYVIGDRDNDNTSLIIEKNGYSQSTQFTSTWGYDDDDDIFLFLGADSAFSTERFEVTGISVEDIYAPTVEPTADPTSAPTINPTTCCCDDPIADMEAEIAAIKQRIYDFGNSAADAAPIPPSMGFTDGDSYNGYDIDLSGKDIFIILLLLVNFIGMIYNRYSMHSKEKRSLNGKKYAVQYDEETDMEPINQ